MGKLFFKVFRCLHSLARNSSKSLISFIFQNDPFAGFYAIVGERKKSDG